MRMLRQSSDFIGESIMLSRLSAYKVFGHSPNSSSYRILQISALLDIQSWLEHYKAARLEDQQEFHGLLSDILANQNQLAETFSE